jgi:glycine cleavage system aminomethyltransferase T
VRPAKGEFIGRAAVLAARDASPDGPARRLRTLVFDEPGYLAAFGGEAVSHDGTVVSRLRSVAYGHGVGRTIATAYLERVVADGTPLAVDVLGQATIARPGPDVLHDPAGLRMRG